MSEYQEMNNELRSDEASSVSLAGIYSKSLKSLSVKVDLSIMKLKSGNAD